MTLDVGCVLLTMGDRPTALQRAVDSVRRQVGVDVDVLVVANGAPAAVEVDGARVLALPENVGIPAGRNRGWREVTGELVCFLDDDAWMVTEDLLVRAAARFAEDPTLGIVSLRIVDEEGRTQRRHVPRVRIGDPTRGSEVTTFLGGASIVRRAVLEQVGGLPDEFFYAHEETSLAWRALDHGWHIHYAGDLAVGHPRTPVARHAGERWHNARNRVLLARRHLPVLLAVTYVAVRLVLQLARDPRGAGVALRGTWAGVRHPDVARDPIRWATVWRLTCLGRPPVV